MKNFDRQISNVHYYLYLTMIDKKKDHFFGDIRSIHIEVDIIRDFTLCTKISVTNIKA